MNWFGRGKVKGEPSVSALLERLGALESAMRQLETEQLTLHDQCRKWMRRALASERAAERVGTQGKPGAPQPTPPPATGVRARRLANRLAEMQGLDFPPAANGHDADEPPGED